jgi:predicted GNAT family N-acyltransferase
VAVFVEEQGVSPDEEIDDLDTLSSRAIHYIAFGDGTPIATARLVIDGVHAKIGRVAVARASRGQGYGASIMRAVMTDAAKRGIRDLTLHSQTHAIAFYQHLGFVAYGDGFLEAGIPHIAMRLATRSKGPSI